MWRNISLAAVSIIIALIVLEGLLRLGGVLFLWQQELSHRRITAEHGECRILCIGESTTALGGEYSYPSQLQHILDTVQDRYQFAVINRGIPSTNTDIILKNLPGEIQKYRPQMIVAMMGINDNAFYAPGGWNSLKTVKLFRLIYAHLTDRSTNIRVKPLTPSDHMDYASQDELNGDYAKAIEIYSYYLYKTPRQDIVLRLLLLGRLADDYRASGDLAKAVDYYREVLKWAPYHSFAWSELGNTYLLLGDYNDAKICLKEHLSLYPKDVAVYSDLVSCLQEQGRSSEIEPLLLQALRVNPNSIDILVELGHFYMQGQHWAQAAHIWEAVLGMPHDSRLLDQDIVMSLKDTYLKLGLTDKARHLEDTFKLTIDAGTQKNFERLKELAIGNGAILVVMQYPMRDIQPLKDLLGGSSRIIYVDNSIIFRQLVSRENYSKYFIDRFGGDFGHATPQGNALIALNLAQAVLKAVGPQGR